MSGVPSSVHPRACGEHYGAHLLVDRRRGSSPRVRGTHRADAGDVAVSRFIPARAGNTSAKRAAITPSAVHPRACGEHVHLFAARAARGGSSPRVRGTHQLAFALGPAERFIPARAGNTVIRSASRLLSSGSSPRVRGTLEAILLRVSFGRFIPARAGNTSLHQRPGNVVSVHPRACGEHVVQLIGDAAPGGSSPRVRGTPLQLSRAVRRRRFIPARAGNTANADVTVKNSCGSSPRVRGTLEAILRRVALGRFIPARAGNTRVRRVR